MSQALASQAGCRARILASLCTGRLCPANARRVGLKTPFKGISKSARADNNQLCVMCTAAAEAGSVGASSTAIAVPPKLSGNEIRERFLAFFEAKRHKRLPSSSLVPEDPTVLLTIAGMLQFKPIFLGQAARQYPCATTTQKCVRTNDIDNVGVTKRHHTFFEMLGNFSFGDYFKREAIKWAWELSTVEFGLPPERLWVSVFRDDDEAYAIWRDEVGVPESRIMRLGEDDNFWAAGATGPCGPCSELYYDFHPERGTQNVNLDDDSRFIEFYNLVFMELNRSGDGSLMPLQNKNIDTGMGLERMAQILQQVPNNYETDLILPIMQKAAELAGVDYFKASDAVKTSLKVIGDHTRAVTYLVSDGVLPSNIGRGYVVRRLLRRVIMKGRLLGIKDTFTPAVAAVAVELSAGCDAQVQRNASRIYEELQREEERFSATLQAGQKQLDEILAAAAQRRSSGATASISGADVFLLYDTFGFPVELTREVAQLQGFDIDIAGFEAELEAQRQRSKDARQEVDLTARAALGDLASSLDATEFLGYLHLHGEGEVLGLLVNGEAVQSAFAGSEVEVLLSRTPFYAESGGQIADRGMLQVEQDNGGSASVLLVNDVQKAGGGKVFVHRCELQSGEVRVGQRVKCVVDEPLRRRIRANHTATHLLQAALKMVLGDQTCQQGSLVEQERLRFDFNLHRPMTEDEVAKVEALVNGWVAESHDVETSVMRLEDAKAAGAVAMFGEKYDDVVRVVNVPRVSMELCGGTHVRNTAELAAFKVLSEGGIASGVRRIEAVAGPAAVDYLNGAADLMRSLSQQLQTKPADLPTRIAALQSDLKATQKQVAELQSQLALAKSSALVNEAVTLPSGARVLVAALDGVDAAALQTAAQQLQQSLGDPAAVVVASTTADGKVSLVAAFSEQVVKSGLQAGKFIGAVAKACGGGGGGRPNLAQAGAKDASKLPAALESAKEQLCSSL